MELVIAMTPITENYVIKSPVLSNAISMEDAFKEDVFAMKDMMYLVFWSKGEFCNEKYILNGVFNANGDAVCNEGWTGKVCDTKSCEKDCSNNGACVNGTCFCNNGFSGRLCDIASCPNSCNYNGVCDKGFQKIIIIIIITTNHFYNYQ